VRERGHDAFDLKLLFRDPGEGLQRIQLKPLSAPRERGDQARRAWWVRVFDGNPSWFLGGGTYIAVLA
jgi:hypothetical protein